jgi:hypothetical protein
MDIVSVLSIGAGVVTTASAICAMTPTPDPNTLWGKVYRYVEMLGLVVGKAKQSGLVPANPVVDQLGADAVAVAKSVISKVAIVGLVCLGLSACSYVRQGEQVLPSFVPAADQPRVAADAAKVEAGIVRACLGSGLFKVADGLFAAALPVASLPVSILNAGVDQVCADPHRFAQDAGTAEWVVKNLAAKAT